MNLSFSCSAIFYMKTIACLKYFVNHSKEFLNSNCHQTSSNMICLTISKGFDTVLIQNWTISKTMLNFVLPDYYFPGLLTKIQIWNWKHLKLCLGRIFRKIKKVPAKVWLLLTITAVNKKLRCRRKFWRHLCS